MMPLSLFLVQYLLPDSSDGVAVSLVILPRHSPGSAQPWLASVLTVAAANYEHACAKVYEHAWLCLLPAWGEQNGEDDTVT